MRKESGKYLRTTFEAAILNQFHGFESYPFPVERDDLIMPGERLYVKFGLDLSFFILLCPGPKEENFMVEAGWSLTGRFPKLTTGSSIDFKSSSCKLYEADALFRIPQLWTWEDAWWKIEPYDFERVIAKQYLPPDQMKKKVDQLVEDVMLKIDQYLLPLFNILAANDPVDNALIFRLFMDYKLNGKRITRNDIDPSWTWPTVEEMKTIYAPLVPSVK